MKSFYANTSGETRRWFDEVGKLLSAGETVEFFTVGKSMFPALLPGKDLVRIRASERYRSGDIVLFSGCKPEGIFLHRIVGMKSGTVTLMGDANLSQKEMCREEDIAGKVVSVIRDGRDITGTPAFRILSAIHYLPFFMRGIAIRVLRITIR